MVNLSKSVFASVVGLLAVSSIAATCESPIDEGGDTTALRTPVAQGDTGTLWQARADSPWCAESCAGLKDWDELVPNPILRGAMYIAYQHAPDWRPLAERAAGAGVRVEVVTPKSALVAAEYDPSSKVIRVAHGLLTEPSSTLAAVLALEVAYANQSFDTTSDSETCVRMEVAADTWAGYVFEATRRGSEKSGFSQSLHEIALAWREGRLDALVRQSGGDRRPCGSIGWGTRVEERVP